ncbi:MAG: DNA mismatch repair protein MutS [Deltaproteobacteria bacterium]|nr:DNA mismatch repair protein MutS [Deltaproteobacteria bacterium]MBZ0219063.1 DNA mismatch repair protein MutS [Deltaproteobacteria bacterium]
MTKSATTPAMRQYLEIKAGHPDSVLFFRMGDFYEMFFEDAKLASSVLGIALTSRDRDREIPMCGVPYHAAAGYIAKLVREGYKVAVCEQTTDPAESKGIVERAVTRVITPGIALDDELLDPKANNFIAAAYADRKASGFAYMDVSTGEFRLTTLPGPHSLIEEIRRLRPLELVIPEGFHDAFAFPDSPVKKVTAVEARGFSLSDAEARLNAHFGTATLDGFGCANMPQAVVAAGALLEYIRSNQKAELRHARKPEPYFPDDFLVLDSSTRRNLEITRNMKSGGRENTLLSVLDRTRTSMGGRRLKSWLLHPLKDAGAIRERLESVEELTRNRDIRSALQESLSRVHDLERLTARLSLGAAGPMDLSSLRESLSTIPDIKNSLGPFSSSLLKGLSLDEVAEAAEAIGRAISENPPHSIKDGGVIREGYSSELDDLRNIGSGGKDWIASLETKERARTGISSLKIGYNRVFGYYIEVTRTNLANVPADYIRKQTLVNAERFITPELKEWEEKILTAEERALKLETALFASLVEELKDYTDRVLGTADSVATLDCLSSLAEASERHGYSKPEIHDGYSLMIECGRHPVVEEGAEDFVSNDLRLNEDERVIILTGPNMAGKSTYLRQNALIILMAQVGSFVPASQASIGVVDRIFTRVGASDDLSRGHSTFMVEMSETANILNNATPRSFIVLDEIGRGTSTFDGLSIAWAVVEHIHDNPSLGAKTLFATHYHELTELSLTKERVKNYNMAVKEWNEQIIFLRKVLPGGANRSYGIQVARLAGVPDEVISRAREILRNLETGELTESGMPRLAARGDRPDGRGQMSLLGERDSLREELRRVDIDTMTPIEAITALHKLKEMLD